MTGNTAPLSSASRKRLREKSTAELMRDSGRRFRWARRNAGFATAAAYASAVGISARSVVRLERGEMRRTGAWLRVMLPLVKGSLLSLDRLFMGAKPDPTSLMGRVRAGDPAALAELRADGADGARLAGLAEAWLTARGGRR